MTVVSDNFNRANESPIAGNWVPFSWSGNAPNLTSNRFDIGTPSGDTHAYWNATFANDQFSQADLTVSGTSGGGSGIGFFLRTNGAVDKNGYRIVVDHAASNNLEIARYNTNGGTGAYTQLKNVTQSFTDGDTWRAEVSGYVVSVYRNGSLVTSYDDSASGSKIASGFVGIAFSSNETSASLDNWSGGDLSGPGIQPGTKTWQFPSGPLGGGA